MTITVNKWTYNNSYMYMCNYNYTILFWYFPSFTVSIVKKIPRGRDYWRKGLSLSLCLSLSLSLSLSFSLFLSLSLSSTYLPLSWRNENENKTKNCGKNRKFEVNFFWGDPVVLPPWHWHHVKEETFFYQGTTTAEKFTDFVCGRAASKWGLHRDMCLPNI